MPPFHHMKPYKGTTHLLLLFAGISAFALVLFNDSLSTNRKQAYALSWGEQSIPSIDEKRQLIATLQALRMHNVTRNQRLGKTMEMQNTDATLVDVYMSSKQAILISQDSAKLIAPQNLPNKGINSSVSINKNTAILKDSSRKQPSYGW